MAEAVAATFEHGGVLLVEAGTGTGKTLAYLVPAILSGERVLVSTGTKNLQEQIYFKDLDILRDALRVPFTATYMKGRGNYLCLHRFDSFRASIEGAGEGAGDVRLFGESRAQVFLPIIEQWAAATWATDPDSAKQTPPMLRAPNGVIADVRAYWLAGKPQYDPGTITVPTLIVHAEWDADLPSYMAQAYFAKLTSAPYKRFVELGEGTHTIIMEKNRMQFFRAVMAFLDETNPLALK